MEIMRSRPEQVKTALDDGIMEVVFAYFLTWLTDLDMDEEDAAQWFLIDYADAWIQYKESILATLGKKVATTNKKKYDKMIAIYKAQYNPLENYDRSEESTHTRTPDLEHVESHDTQTGTVSNANTLSSINQTQTTTTTPTGYGSTTTHKVSPFDTTNYQNADETEVTMQGTQDVETSYAGDPDQTETHSGSTTSVSGDITRTETGTEETTITSSIHGNIGVMSSQQMAEQELALAEKMAIWTVIERDVAAAILLQVW